MQLYLFMEDDMDVYTLRLFCIFAMVVVGLFVIPFGYLFYLGRKFDGTPPWYLMLPVILTYLVLFFSYIDHLVPEKWTLVPTEAYTCEWKTTYIPKYPTAGW